MALVFRGTGFRKGSCCGSEFQKRLRIPEYPLVCWTPIYIPPMGLLNNHHPGAGGIGTEGLCGSVDHPRGLGCVVVSL